MKKNIIGIIGEFNSASKSHTALNQSLRWLKKDFNFEFEWIDTLKVEKQGNQILKNLSGIWSASGSPFKSLNGSLLAIKYARTHNIPHLGTCGGFQHSIIEFARNVLGITEAQHEKYDKHAPFLFISKLVCSLAGKTMSIKIKEGSKAFECYKSENSTEDYYCNFGINPIFKDKLICSDLLISGIDQNGEIRIIEIPKNDFFLATLFVPQSRSTEYHPHPIIKSYIEECVKRGYS